MSTEQPTEGGHKKPPIPTPAKKVPAYNIEKRGDRLYQAQTLHKWFAVSSLLLFFITVGMVMKDYTREWKQYQRDFNKLSIASAAEDYYASLGTIDASKYNALRSDYEAALTSQNGNSGAISQAEEQVAALNAQFIRMDQLYKTTKAQYDTDKYAYDEAAAHALPNEAKKKAVMDKTAAMMDQYFLDREQLNTKMQDAKAELNKLQDKATNDKKQALAMRAEMDRIGRQINALNPGKLVTTIINAPMMDFLKPSLQIKQILLPNLFYDQPFKQISRADRCTTCHLGIDNKKFAEAEQPFRTHPNMEMYLGANSPHPMEKFGCTSCHGGLDRSTDFITVGHTPKDKKQEDDWEFKYGWDPKSLFREASEPMLAMPNIEAGCYKCHSSSSDVPRAAHLANGRELIKQFGCWGCHKIPGYENMSKVGPDLATVSGKLTQDWAKKWLANPKDFKPEARMPKFWYNTNNSGVQNGIDWDKRNVAEINAIVAFLWSKSTPQTLPTKNTNGNAAKGKEIVETKGCFGCHSVGKLEEAPGKPQTRRRHGYNLENQGSKVTANWIANWVADPHLVRHDTKMPNLRLSDSEVADATAYLSSMKNPEWEKKAAPETDLSALKDVTREFLRSGSTQAKAEEALAKMNPEQMNLYAGEKLIGKYGCYGCHNVPGFEKAQPIGTELTEAGSKLISQLDFGFLPIAHEREAWYEAKLHDPRIFDKGRVKRTDELLRMPNFGLNEEQVHSVVMVLTSMVKDRVPMEMRERPDPDVQEGRLLVSEKNCKGCHIIEGLGGDIRLALKENTQWPPNLSTQGQKTQPEFLRAFLKNPGDTKVRWWLDTRMPTFNFTEHQIAAIGKYFARLDKVDWGWIDTEIQTTSESIAAGKELFEGVQCGKCHPTAPGSTTAALSVPGTAGTGGPAPNLSGVHNRLRPDWVQRWVMQPSLIDGTTRMPDFFVKDGKKVPFVSDKPGAKPILNGDVDAQVRALRDYVYTLGKR